MKKKNTYIRMVPVLASRVVYKVRIISEDGLIKIPSLKLDDGCRAFDEFGYASMEDAIRDITKISNQYRLYRETLIVLPFVKSIETDEQMIDPNW